MRRSQLHIIECSYAPMQWNLYARQMSSPLIVFWIQRRSFHPKSLFDCFIFLSWPMQQCARPGYASRTVSVKYSDGDFSLYDAGACYCFRRYSYKNKRAPVFLFYTPHIVSPPNPYGERLTCLPFAGISEKAIRPRSRLLCGLTLFAEKPPLRHLLPHFSLSSPYSVRSRTVYSHILRGCCKSAVKKSRNFPSSFLFQDTKKCLYSLFSVRHSCVRGTHLVLSV